MDVCFLAPVKLPNTSQWTNDQVYESALKLNIHSSICGWNNTMYKCTGWGGRERNPGCAKEREKPWVCERERETDSSLRTIGEQVDFCSASKTICKFSSCDNKNLRGLGALCNLLQSNNVRPALLVRSGCLYKFVFMS